MSTRYERVSKIVFPVASRFPETTLAISPGNSNTDMKRTCQVAANDAHDDAVTSLATAIPDSPPPSFRSYPSSRRPSRDNLRRSEEERDLDNAFDAPSDDGEDDDNLRDRQRLISSTEAPSPAESGPHEQAGGTTRPDMPGRTTTTIPSYAPGSSSGRPVGSSQANDGVFANLNAKPRAGDDLEEKPPVSLPKHSTTALLNR